MSLIGSATGRMFLALLDESRVRKLAQEELASSPDDLRAQLDKADPIGALQRQVRAAGCATVRDTNLKGISAMAAPLFDERPSMRYADGVGRNRRLRFVNRRADCEGIARRGWKDQ